LYLIICSQNPDWYNFTGQYHSAQIIYLEFRASYWQTSDESLINRPYSNTIHRI